MKVEARKVFDERTMVFDGYDNFVSKVGLNNDNTLSAGLYAFNYVTRNRVQLEAAYRGSWIVGQVVDCVAEDMTRAGATVSTNEAEEDIADFDAAVVQTGIWTSLCSLIKWGRLYGGAIAVLQIDGQALDTPLNINRIRKDQFTGLAVYDRWQLNPLVDKIIKDGPEIGLPEYYQIVTTAQTTTPGNQAGQEAAFASGFLTVHHSRVIRNIGIELPFFQAITEMLWGESILERMWDRLIAFDDSTMSSANLIERANNRTVKIENLREIVAMGGKAMDGLKAQFSMMRQFQTNEGLTILDSKDEFSTSNYTFTGLSDLLIQFGQQLSGAANIPLVRLFGQSPAGMNATGESDIRMYYDYISAQQNAKLRLGLDKIFKVLWMSTFGTKPPKDLKFTFVPLWQMSAMDRAAVVKSNTETIIGAHDAGLITTGTAVKELKDQGAETGMFTNITDEEIQEAEQEPPPIQTEEPPPSPKADNIASEEYYP